MASEQRPVNDMILYTNISKSDERNWEEMEKGVKWQYKRNPAVTAFEILTIIDMAGMKREYVLDNASQLTYEIRSYGNVSVQGQVHDHT